MRSEHFKLAALFAAMLVAACNSGGEKNQPRSSQSYNQLLLSVDDLTAKYRLNATRNPETPPLNVPITGSATYNGVALVNLSDNDSNTDTGRFRDIAAQLPVAGNAHLTADFSKSTISGEISDFRAFDPEQKLSGLIKYKGNIRLNTTSGRFTGNVTKSGEKFEVNLPGDGGFVGPGADGLFIFGEKGDQRILVATEK